ncbi:MAG TPA: hypothetical protein VLA53_04610 [Nitrosopumilaceae archaeon]|nr:hypothetical protein [Nitrosopumilaceae archaeon]
MKRTSSWGNKFILSAIIQGAIITGLTISVVGAQMVSSSVNIIQFLSLSFDGPAKWFFLGYVFYMILVVAIATTAIFYNHLEINMEKNIRGVRAVMAWIHLIGMNIGGAATTISMILAGLMGSGALDLILSGGSTTELQQNPAIMDQFIPPIATFAGVLSIGVIVGGISYITTYLQKSDTINDIT